jgi:protein dpy-30
MSEAEANAPPTEEVSAAEVNEEKPDVAAEVPPPAEAPAAATESTDGQVELKEGTPDTSDQPVDLQSHQAMETEDVSAAPAQEEASKENIEPVAAVTEDPVVESTAAPNTKEASPAQAPPAAAISGAGGDTSSKMSTRQYLDSTVVPILLQGLSAVAKERPTDPIGFLADFLVKNKEKFQAAGKE